jgi:type II secretory pathway pseudopilin PulG
MSTRGFTLISTLVTIALILFLSAYLMFGSGGGKSLRKDGEGKTYLGAAMARAKDANCITQLQQVRAALEIATDPVEGTRPAALQDLRIGGQFYRCPIGNEPYTYDPAAASPKEAVKCPHPGHEKH